MRKDRLRNLAGATTLVVGGFTNPFLIPGSSQGSTDMRLQSVQQEQVLKGVPFDAIAPSHPKGGEVESKKKDKK